MFEDERAIAWVNPYQTLLGHTLVLDLDEPELETLAASIRRELG